MLLDLNLPDLPGAEVTRRLLDAQASARVLVLSASAERQDVLDAVTAGRETEVLRLVAKALTYPQIAERLVLSPRTVQNHVQNTLTKLQLSNKAQLVRYALEEGVD